MCKYLDDYFDGHPKNTKIHIEHIKTMHNLDMTWEIHLIILKRFCIRCYQQGLGPRSSEETSDSHCLIYCNFKNKQSHAPQNLCTCIYSNCLEFIPNQCGYRLSKTKIYVSVIDNACTIKLVFKPS